MKDTKKLDLFDIVLCRSILKLARASRITSAERLGAKHLVQSISDSIAVRGRDRACSGHVQPQKLT